MISVIVPVYNTEEYVDKCIQSIIEQTYCDFEILLIDDGSTDSSGSLCDNWGKKDSRIRVFHKTNGGLASARNFALGKVEGDYIAWVDSDDYIDKHYLEVLLNAVEQQQADMVLCSYWNVQGEQVIFEGKKRFANVTYSAEQFLEKVYTYGMYSSLCNKLLRREFYEGIIFPEGRFFEDSAVMRELVCKCERIVVMEKPLYYYRQRSGSITMKQRNCEEAYDYLLQFCEWIQNDIGLYIEENNTRLLAYASRHLCHAIIIHSSELDKKARRGIKKDIYNKYVGYIIRSQDIEIIAKLKYLIAYMNLSLGNKIDKIYRNSVQTDICRNK